MMSSGKKRPGINLNFLYKKLITHYQQNGFLTPWKNLTQSPRFPRLATTTPAAPYSSTDLLGPYSNENRLPSTDDLRIGNGGLTDRDRGQKVTDLERRPSSRKESKKSLSFNGQGYLEREKEKDRERDSRDRLKDGDAGPLLSPAVTSQGKNYFKPMGMRNNFLSGQQIPPSQRNAPPPPLNPVDKINRDPDDLVAMGTNWNPPNNNSNSQRSNGHRPGSYGNSGSNISLPQNPSGGLAPVSGTRKLGTGRPGVYGAHSVHGRQHQQAKDSEPKYSDPLVGAPPTFQQRLAELAAIEAETIRWEKARKMKKKSKDS